MAHGYDPKCYDLAKSFLSDEPTINNAANANRLAQEIQDTIENFIGDKVYEYSQQEPPDDDRHDLR